MSAVAPPSNINIRVKPDERAAIEAAAAERGQTITRYMLDAALAAARDGGQPSARLDRLEALVDSMLRRLEALELQLDDQG